jgi:hypothetical protein
MKNWFSKVPLPRISKDIVPDSLRARIDKWEALGRNVEIINMSHDGVAIMNVVIHAPEGMYPFFANGAAASDVSAQEALTKAFDEAELGLLEALHADPVPLIDPKDVKSPADHGKLYLHHTYRKQIEWLWSGPYEMSFPEIPVETDIIRQFQPIILKYTSDESPLCVVRAICPQLVPINFGYGNEHHSHLAVKNADFEKPQLPHYFA